MNYNPNILISITKLTNSTYCCLLKLNIKCLLLKNRYKSYHITNTGGGRFYNITYINSIFTCVFVLFEVRLDYIKVQECHAGAEIGETHDVVKSSMKQIPNT